MTEQVQRCQPAVPAAAGAATWEDSHQAELEYQQEGRLKRKLQALKDGTLLPEEADNELETFIETLAAKKSELLKAPGITAKEQKKDVLHAGPSRPGFLSPNARGNQDLKVFVCAGVVGAKKLVDGLNLGHVRDPGMANVIVTETLRKLPETVHLAAGLRGSYVVDIAALHGQERCLCFKFKPSGHLKRHIWISDDFKKEGLSLLLTSRLRVYGRRMGTSTLHCGMSWRNACLAADGAFWIRWTNSFMAKGSRTWP